MGTRLSHGLHTHHKTRFIFHSPWRAYECCAPYRYHDAATMTRNRYAYHDPRCPAIGVQEHEICQEPRRSVSSFVVTTRRTPSSFQQTAPPDEGRISFFSAIRTQPPPHFSIPPLNARRSKENQQPSIYWKEGTTTLGRMRGHTSTRLAGASLRMQ
jgi:hypothetical protein